MIQYLCKSIAVLAMAAGVAVGQDYRLEPLQEAPPSDALSAGVLAKLSTEGVRVVRGERTTLCEIWFCKEIPVQADFQATSAVSYPLTWGT